MIPLRVPLATAQIEAAQRIQAYSGGLSAVSRALAELRDRFPGFDPVASLLKTVVLNQLLSTNVWAVVRMAEHIAAVMRDVSPTDADYDLVDRIAALPGLRDPNRVRRHLSFASKFAGWFIDSERFPIYDGVAWQMLRYHLGARELTWDDDRQYASFVENVDRLRQRADLDCSFVALDAYLWTAGLYQAWKRNNAAEINGEMARLFAAPPADLVEPLAALLPYSDVG